VDNPTKLTALIAASEPDQPLAVVVDFDQCAVWRQVSSAIKDDGCRFPSLTTSGYALRAKQIIKPE